MFAVILKLRTWYSKKIKCFNILGLFFNYGMLIKLPGVSINSLATTLVTEYSLIFPFILGFLSEKNDRGHLEEYLFYFFRAKKYTLKSQTTFTATASQLDKRLHQMSKYLVTVYQKLHAPQWISFFLLSLHREKFTK